MAGEDLNHFRRNLPYWKGEAREDALTVLPHYGTLCPAQGCYHCTENDCPYAEFIRHYWNCPHGE